MAVFDVLEEARPRGETRLVPVLHELAETVSQRALIVIISDLFVEPELLRPCFQHLRFRKHDTAVFHLLDPQELRFDFRRPMRFLDLEGGRRSSPSPSRSPSATTRRCANTSSSCTRWCWSRPSPITGSPSTSLMSSS
jgi:hypothetical protein